MTRLLALLGLALWTVLTAGCAGAPTAEQRDPSQRAYAILSVSHDLEAGAAADTIVYLDESRYPGPIQLSSMKGSQTDFTTRRGRLHIVSLPAGVHTIDDWQVHSALTRFHPRQWKPLSFELRPGEVVYLGNLHARLALGHKTLGGGRVATDARIVLNDRRGEDIAVAEAMYPVWKGAIRVALLPEIAEDPIPGSSETFDPLPRPITPNPAK